MKKTIVLLCMYFVVGEVAVAQNVQDKQQEVAKKYEEMFKQLEEESRAYYSGADTAIYGIRYLWSYIFDKPHKCVYHEDRILIISPVSTEDRDYQSMGERTWMKKHYKDKVIGNDSTLAGQLTPSFYFYRPEQKRLQHTYRIVTEEFLLKDTVVEIQWNILNEKKNIGGFNCQKAVCRYGGRAWQVWFTQELPYVGGPRHLVGLPGVVMEASDETREISWKFQEIIKSDAEKPLFVKYPDKFSDIPHSRFPIVKRLFALTDRNYIQRSGIAELHPHLLPEVLYPYTGIDAYYISNPIEKE